MRIFDHHDDLPLRCGETLRGARLRVAVWGELNAARDNLVLFPTSYAGNHEHITWAIGPGRPLDPARWCVVCPNQLGNGESASPSDGAPFPAIDHADNVEAQRRMLAAHFNGADIALTVGWSMGAQQACRWAVEEPGKVERLMMSCGAARTRPHNRVFLESLLTALAADPDFAAGGPAEAGLRAVGRIYAGWAYSQGWLKREGWRALGFDSLEAWLSEYWEARWIARHPGNLASMARTWIAHDVADGGDLAAALGRITARTVVMAGATDLYFTPADLAEDAAMIPGARYAEFDSDWGHMAGSGQNPADVAAFDREVAALLQS